MVEEECLKIWDPQLCVCIWCMLASALYIDKLSQSTPCTSPQLPYSGCYSKYQRQDGLICKHLFLIILETGQSKIKVLADPALERPSVFISCPLLLPFYVPGLKRHWFTHSLCLESLSRRVASRLAFLKDGPCFNVETEKHKTSALVMWGVGMRMRGDWENALKQCGPVELSAMIAVFYIDSVLCGSYSPYVAFEHLKYSQHS